MIGIRCTDGVVLGVEKLIRNKMLVTKSYRRIFTTSMHSGMAIGGLLPDGRQLVNRVRDESSSYKTNFGIRIPGPPLCADPCTLSLSPSLCPALTALLCIGSVLANRLAMYVHAYTEYWHLRPFGVSSLLAVYDESECGPQLYCVEPSGECLRYYGVAVGKNAQAAKVQLEKLNFDSLSCREAVNVVAEIIYSLHDEVKDKPFEMELSWICDDSDRKHRLVPQSVFDEAVAAGLKAAEDEDSDVEEEEEDEDMVDQANQ